MTEGEKAICERLDRLHDLIVRLAGGPPKPQPDADPPRVTNGGPS